MDEQYYEERECDHDDEVMCTHMFFDHTTNADLARRHLANLIQARTHWIVAVTPECQSYAYRLNALHLERCGDGMSFMHIPELRIHPLLCTLPKGQVSYDDLVGVIGHIPGVSREVVEAKAWILLTSGDVEAGMAAVDRYIAVDPLCN